MLKYIPTENTKQDLLRALESRVKYIEIEVLSKGVIKGDIMQKLFDSDRTAFYIPELLYANMKVYSWGEVYSSFSF